MKMFALLLRGCVLKPNSNDTKQSKCAEGEAFSPGKVSRTPWYHNPHHNHAYMAEHQKSLKEMHLRIICCFMACFKAYTYVLQ